MVAEYKSHSYKANPERWIGKIRKCDKPNIVFGMSLQTFVTLFLFYPTLYVGIIWELFFEMLRKSISSFKSRNTIEKYVICQKACKITEFLLLKSVKL